MPAQVCNGTRVPLAIQAAVYAYYFTTDTPPPIKHIAEKAGIDAKTVKGILANKEIANRVSNTPEVQAIKKNMGNEWYLRAQEALNHITPNKLEEMSAYQLTGMAGIAHQNARLAESDTTGTGGLNFTIMIQQSLANDPNITKPVIEVTPAKGKK